MSERNATQFGRLPRAKTMSGDLAAIASQPCALAVYLAYAAHADADWRAYLGETSISRAFGISPDSVRRGRRACERHGLLTATGDTLHRCRVYRVNVTPRNPRTRAGDRSPLSPAADTGEPPHGARPSPAAVQSNPRTRAGQTERTDREQQQQNSAGPAAAGAAPAQDPTQTPPPDPIADALADAGIADPTRARLAATLAARLPPDAAVVLIRAQAATARERGKWAGALIRNIEAAAEAKARRDAEAAAKAAAKPAPPASEPTGLIVSNGRKWREARGLALPGETGDKAAIIKAGAEAPP